MTEIESLRLDLSQALAERDAAVNRAEEDEAQLAKVRHDRDEMIRVHDEVEADRDVLREEVARLRKVLTNYWARFGAIPEDDVGLRMQAKLSRAVAALREMRDAWDEGDLFRCEDARRAAVAILADNDAADAEAHALKGGR